MNIEHYFSYCPVRTDKRKNAHETINKAALDFAKIIECEVADEEIKKMAFYAIQQARMFANQGATIDELRESEERERPPQTPDPKHLKKLWHV